MKFHLLYNGLPELWSRPAWGAWIEIVIRDAIRQLASVAPRMGRVD